MYWISVLDRFMICVYVIFSISIILSAVLSVMSAQEKECRRKSGMTILGDWIFNLLKVSVLMAVISTLLIIFVPSKSEILGEEGKEIIENER